MKIIDPQVIINVRKWTAEEMMNTILVFDGGDDDCPPIKQPPYIKWTAIRVKDTMHIPDSEPDLGLTFFKPADDTNPVFTRVPRSVSLAMTGINDATIARNLRDALLSAINHTKATNIRGTTRHTFSPRPVANLGAQPCRGKRGVSANSYHKKLMDPAEWDAIIRFTICCEAALKHVIPREAIRHIQAAQDLTDYKVMQSTSGLEADSSNIYSAINIAIDPILPGHVDDDIMYSVVTCLLQDDHTYKPEDLIVAYFCFPSLGIAVPLRPGDILIFNPLEPHCISSKCRSSDTVLGTSMYVKTAIVGLNDNSIKPMPKDDMLAHKFDELHK